MPAILPGRPMEVGEVRLVGLDDVSGLPAVGEKRREGQAGVGEVGAVDVLADSQQPAERLAVGLGKLPERCLVLGGVWA